MTAEWAATAAINFEKQYFRRLLVQVRTRILYVLVTAAAMHQEPIHGSFNSRFIDIITMIDGSLFFFSTAASSRLAILLFSSSFAELQFHTTRETNFFFFLHRGFIFLISSFSLSFVILSPFSSFFFSSF